MTEPAVGASVWARGSQVWTGKRGTLTAKPAMSPRKRTYLEMRGDVGRVAVEVGEGEVERTWLDSPVVEVADVEEGGEGEYGAGEGEEEEFSGGLAAIGAAPDADDEEHGDEGEFKEEVEDEEVFGGEDAEHSGVEDEHPGVELGLAFLDVVVAGEDGDGGEEGGEDDEPEADGVDAHEELDAEAGDPEVLEVVVPLAVGALGEVGEVGDDVDDDGEGDEGEDEGDGQEALGLCLGVAKR